MSSKSFSGAGCRRGPVCAAVAEANVSVLFVTHQIASSSSSFFFSPRTHLWNRALMTARGSKREYVLCVRVCTCVSLCLLYILNVQYRLVRCYDLIIHALWAAKHLDCLLWKITLQHRHTHPRPLPTHTHTWTCHVRSFIKCVTWPLTLTPTSHPLNSNVNLKPSLLPWASSPKVLIFQSTTSFCLGLTALHVQKHTVGHVGLSSSSTSLSQKSPWHIFEF